MKKEYAEMVFYFTGTGNSLYAAKMLDEIRISIPQAIRKGETEFAAETIGIVCPVYGHELPEIVKRFLKESTFHADYFYLVMTYGNIHGGAAELADEYLKTCGIEADYINTVMMADNYLPVFDMNEQIAGLPKKHVEAQIAKIQVDLKKKKRWKQPATVKDRYWHERYLEMSKEHPIDPEKGIFRVLSSCIGCGVCTRVCPTGRIRINDQHAGYHEMSRCQMCLACVHHCPQNAIRLTIPEKNPTARYHNEKIRLSEIVEANDQTGKED